MYKGFSVHLFERVLTLYVVSWRWSDSIHIFKKQAVRVGGPAPGSGDRAQGAGRRWLTPPPPRSLSRQRPRFRVYELGKSLTSRVVPSQTEQTHRHHRMALRFCASSRHDRWTTRAARTRRGPKALHSRPPPKTTIPKGALDHDPTLPAMPWP
jgi:hypothetical protein